jgi:hypothetical protein
MVNVAVEQVLSVIDLDHPSAVTARTAIRAVIQKNTEVQALTSASVIS